MFEKDILVNQARIDDIQRCAARQRLAHQVRQFNHKDCTLKVNWRRWLPNLRMRREFPTNDLMRPVTHLKSEV